MKTLMKPSTLLYKPFWKAATWFGLRRMTGFLQTHVESYRDTLTHVATDEKVIGLTMDDGLCRDDPTRSMVAQVSDCLEQYDAKATFFVCSDYLQGPLQEEAQGLIEKGHELGNHLEADKAFHYHRLAPEEFQNILEKTNHFLDELEGENTTSTRWFRAPQGILTKPMHQIMTQQPGKNIRHVLGDIYCDDWKFAQDFDNATPDQRTKVMKQVANLMLSQVHPGSIAILHMPQRGFREGTLEVLQFFLQGLQERGYKCANLTQLAQLEQSTSSWEQAANNMDNGETKMTPETTTLTATTSSFTDEQDNTLQSNV